MKDEVLKYLLSQNRPHSANDIVQHFGKDANKTNIQKALDDLVDEDWVFVKVYGKQKVYSAKQYDEAVGESVQAEILELNDLTSELTKTEQELLTIENEKKRYSNQVSTEDAVKMENELLESVKKLEEKLQMLSEKGTKVSAGDKQKLTKEKDFVAKEYKKRKRICLDTCDAILENYPKPKRMLFEEAGIFFDDEPVPC